MIGRACYIAGPMTGVANYNFASFFGAEESLRAAGWKIIFNPARMDVNEWGLDRSKPIVLQVPKFTMEMRRDVIRRDLRVLTDYLAGEEGDAIVLLPGWYKSVGTLAEIAVSKWLQLRILLLKGALTK